MEILDRKKDRYFFNDFNFKLSYSYSNIYSLSSINFKIIKNRYSKYIWGVNNAPLTR